MATDVARHVIPADGESFLPVDAFEELSKSIRDVRTAADLTTAETLRGALETAGVDTDGTAWWVVAEEALYVYRATADAFSKIRDEAMGTRPQRGVAQASAIMNSGTGIGSSADTARVAGVITVGTAPFPRLVTYTFNVGVTMQSTDNTLAQARLVVGSSTDLPADPGAMALIDTTLGAWSTRQAAYYVFRNPAVVDTRSGFMTHTEFVPADSEVGNTAIAAVYRTAGSGTIPIVADLVGNAAEVFWIEVDEADGFATLGGEVY
ncbi:hypothetical protein [Isoptericola aurantiacus]|uniref:hypothetical protein n=1 Tax=Isoptericola aurantiacus TaxID=3377839 RepID=UPI00383B2945